MSLREKGAVTGVGETDYMRGTDRTALSLQLEASLKAIDDAGLKPTDIDGVIPYGLGAVAEDFVTNFGIPDLRFSATTPMGGASADAAVPRCGRVRDAVRRDRSGAALCADGAPAHGVVRHHVAAIR